MPATTRSEAAPHGAPPRMVTGEGRASIHLLPLAETEEDDVLDTVLGDGREVWRLDAHRHALVVLEPAVVARDLAAVVRIEPPERTVVVLDDAAEQVDRAPRATLVVVLDL